MTVTIIPIGLDVYRQLYGGREVLGYLGEVGVEAVETPVGPETTTAELREHVARCVDAGLKVSLHPYSEGTVCNPAFFLAEGENPCRALHERLLALAAEAARLQQSSTIVNIHGASDTSADSRRQLVDRSVRFFTWAGEWCRRNAPEVGVTVELQISPNGDGPRQRVGDSYEELLGVATAGGVAACWDFGHAYWNTRRFGSPLYPPQELVGRISHVHCHDVRDEDHQPLVYDVVPWRDFLKLLIDAGFDGRIILEVPPSEFLRAGGLKALTGSVRALRAWVQQCTSELRPR